MTMPKWVPFKDGATIGQFGCDGYILRDEEFDGGARITLELVGDHCEIVCGVYGTMVHTAFEDRDHADEKYEDMRRELGAFMAGGTTPEEECEFYAEFTGKWW